LKLLEPKIGKLPFTKVMIYKQAGDKNKKADRQSPSFLYFASGHLFFE